MLYVLSTGGSIINPGTIDVKYLKGLAALLSEMVEKGHKFVIVCGGGKTARDYAFAAKELGATEGEADLCGIAATWINSQLVRTLLKQYAPLNQPSSIKEVRDNLQTYSIEVCGGFLPALKTDEDAAIIADLLGADYIINMTDVRGVYDTDPRKNPNAKLLDSLTYKEFYKIIGGIGIGAGAKAPFTLIATQICERSEIKILVIDGKNLENLRAFYEGKKVEGTIVG
ncbi:MAG: UMP kinase [Promethearchaeota archaeon]